MAASAAPVKLPEAAEAKLNVPPPAMSCYSLRGAAPPRVQPKRIFRGCMAFLLMVRLAMVLMDVFPELVQALPDDFHGVR